MKQTLLLLLLVKGLLAIPHIRTESDGAVEEDLQSFQKFKQEFGKNYANSDEEAARFAVYRSNIQLIREHNKEFKAGKSTFWMHANKFADYTDQEYAKILGFKRRSAKKTVQDDSCTHSTVIPPEAIDWRSNGAVATVKDQGQCGSCWTFSATGAIEGAWFIKSGELLSLSEEEILQCDNDPDENGCDGGDMDSAFGWVVRNGGIATEDEYPYVSGVSGVTGNCSTKRLRLKDAHIASYCDVESGDEEALEKAVSQQPVAVGIEADQKSFQFYAGGVLPAHRCGVKLDHGVLVVGFGRDDKRAMDYWVVKNSWGPDWGEEGYIRLQKFPGAGNHSACGVALAASYAVV